MGNFFFFSPKCLGCSWSVWPIGTPLPLPKRTPAEVASVPLPVCHWPMLSRLRAADTKAATSLSFHSVPFPRYTHSEIRAGLSSIFILFFSIIHFKFNIEREKGWASVALLFYLTTHLEALTNTFYCLTVTFFSIPLLSGETKTETVKLKHQKIYNVIETTLEADFRYSLLSLLFLVGKGCWMMLDDVGK